MTKKRDLGARDLVVSGMLAAICAVATFIKIPFGVGAMVHLGTAALYIAGVLYGGVYAGLAGAIGSALFDLIMGFSAYTLWSFVIKGIAGFIVGTVAQGIWPENAGREFSRVKILFACVLAAVWTAGAYILAWWQVIGSLTTALANLPSSLLTSGVGLVLAFFLSPKLRQML